MKYSYLFKICSTLLVLFISLACEKEYKAGGPLKSTTDLNDDIIVIDESLGNFFDDKVSSATQRYTADARYGNIIKGSKGVILSIPANAFKDNSGNLITGDVDVEIIEIYEREDMLLLNKSTNAIRNSESGILISGGQLYINAFYNGEQVFLDKSIEVDIPTENTGGADFQMKLWDGEIQANGDMLWSESSIPMTIKDSAVASLDSFNFQNVNLYNINITGFGWVNCDKWYSDPRPKSIVSTLLPEGYSNLNSKVFYTYVNEPNLLGNLRSYDLETGVFYDYSGVPIGIEMHLIALANIEDQLYYQIITTTVVENHLEIFSDMQLVTEEDLEAAVQILQ